MTLWWNCVIRTNWRILIKCVSFRGRIKSVLSMIQKEARGWWNEAKGRDDIINGIMSQSLQLFWGKEGLLSCNSKGSASINGKVKQFLMQKRWTLQLGFPWPLKLKLRTTSPCDLYDLCALKFSELPAFYGTLL